MTELERRAALEREAELEQEAEHERRAELQRGAELEREVVKHAVLEHFCAALPEGRKFKLKGAESKETRLQ